MNTPALTLAGLGQPESGVGRTIYYPLLAILGSVAIGAAAQFQVPFYPVPMTLQTLAVLIIGGAFGNVVDRLRFGYVVDYIDTHVWPVFNLADAAVVVGASVLIAATMAGRRGGA